MNAVEARGDIRSGVPDVRQDGASFCDSVGVVGFMRATTVEATSPKFDCGCRCGVVQAGTGEAK